MKKYTQKAIRTMIAEGYARELVNEEDIPGNYEKIGISTGIYGMNAGLIQDVKTGQLWGIPARNTMLFIVF